MTTAIIPGVSTGTEVVPSNMALVPTSMILGIPWYFWGFVVVAVFVLFIIVMFAYYYVTMSPVGAYFWSAWKNEDILLFWRMSGKLTFRQGRYLTGVINDNKYPLSWIQRSDASARLGKCSVKMVCDMTGIATEPSINMAIKTWVTEHNDAELKKQAEMYKNNESYDPRLITDYYDLYEAVKDGIVEDPVTIPAVFEVPLWEIQRFLPEIGSGDLEGHIATRIEEDKQAELNADKHIPGWLWFFIAVECCILIPVVLIILTGG